MNFYGKESGPQHTITGRVIPLCEAMHRAILKASDRPLEEPRHSVCLPDWVHKLCDELTKTIFKGMIESDPRENKFVARDYGRIVGFILRGVVFYVKEVPALLKDDGLLDLTDERAEKLKKEAGLPMLFAMASQTFQKPIANEEALIQEGGERVKEKGEELLKGFFLIGRHLLNQPIEEQHEFLCGIPEGFVSFLNNQGEFAGKRRMFEIFLLLAMHWPEIAEMQKEQPAKTRKYLLEWLEKEEGKQLVEDAKVFYAICDDIGLDMAPPGHPVGVSSGQLSNTVFPQSVVVPKED
jgi:hypothetical protein